MAGFITPGEEYLPDPFQVTDCNVYTNLLLKFSHKCTGIGFAEYHMTAGERKCSIICRLLQ